METLAYLHYACAYNEASGIESVEIEDNETLFNRFNWQRLSSQACLVLIPVVIALGILGDAQQANASHSCGGYSRDRIVNCTTRTYRVRRRVAIHRPRYYHHHQVRYRPVYRYKYDQEYPVAIARPSYYQDNADCGDNSGCYTPVYQSNCDSGCGDNQFAVYDACSRW
jgi:hypothetical protein